MQSDDTFRDYLLNEKEPPLTPRAASDYIARLHRIERILDLDDFDISPGNVEMIIHQMRKKSVAFGIGAAVQNDCATALRSYAEFRR